MKNIILITKREFITQVKKKSFVVLTLLAPLMMIGFGAIITYMFKANETVHTFDVADGSGLFTGKLKSDDNIRYIFVPQSSVPQLKSGLKDMKGTDGLLIIPPLSNKDYGKMAQNTTLLINNKIGLDTRMEISKKLREIVRREKIKDLGISGDKFEDIDKSYDFKTQNVWENARADDDLVYGVKSGLAMGLMYVTFMFIVIYGVRVMRSVLEEKNNRVVEIIISSVKPFELMMGKILGVTLVALTQFAAWITMSVAGAAFFNKSFKSQTMAQAAEMPGSLDTKTMVADISHTLLSMDFPLIIFVFIVFFLFGYIFYSSIYAAIGSAVDNETETSQFTMFAIVPLMLGLYGSFSIMKNPEGPIGFWLSIIPFTSPVAMIARIPYGVPAWQIALSMALLVTSTLLMVYIAAKVYRVGILMYGNKATPKELWKWIRG